MRNKFDRYQALVLMTLMLSVTIGAVENNEFKQEAIQGKKKTQPGLVKEIINEPQQDLSVNEPIYFVVGGAPNSDTKARFQFSFKYKIFSDEGMVDKSSWLNHLHLGYTQTSLWNLSAESAPFEDSSYRPSFFMEKIKLRDGLLPDVLRYGYEHESNGQANELSRSIDTAFLATAWNFTLLNRDLIIGSKAYGYLTKGSENPDIRKYRGNVDLLVRYGNDDGLITALTSRLGTEGKGSMQLDITHPIRKKIFARTGGYFMAQLFQGYGESLRSYDVNTDLQVRIGFAIVR